MSQTLKGIVAAAIGVAVLAIGFAAVVYSIYYARSIQPSSFRSFSVSADGKSVSIPDVAQFSFTVITEGGKDLTALQGQNTVSVNKAIAFVKAQGVSANDIKTSYYNVDPRYENYSCYESPVRYDIKSMEVAPGSGSSSGVAMPASPTPATVKTCPPPSIVGYTVTQSVSVKIRDFSKVGDIMSGVVTNGANQVGSLAFTLDDPSSAQDEARNEAIAKARDKAEEMARAGGFSIGRLLSVQEGRGAYPMYEKSVSLDSYSGAGSSAPAPAIEPGSQETNVTVTMTFEIR